MIADPITELPYGTLTRPHTQGGRLHKVYYRPGTRISSDWIAEGSDGDLYLVPAEPGGWLRRELYVGPVDDLSRVPDEQAGTVVWYVYGDVGPVTIA
jgi:hypothetical protein